MDEIVQTIVDANPGAEIDIIGHSLGGVIVTYWAATTTKSELLEHINSIITLDSPLQGEGGRCWKRIGFTIIPSGVTSKISGSVVKAPILTISNPNDEVVPPSSSVLAEGLAWSDFSSRSGESCCICVTGTSGHTTVKTDPDVWARIEKALLAGRILNPTWQNKLFVGPCDDPGSGFVSVAKPTYTFLSAPGFQALVDSQGADVSIVNFDDKGVTRLKTQFPTQPTNGDYSLTAIADSPLDRWDFTDTEADAVTYGPGAGNVDVVLVIDRSGSMTGQKITDAKDAAKLFVDLMTDGDKIGVVSFSSTATVNYGLTTIAGSVKLDAKSAIYAISAGGNTSIGAGLQKGANELTNKGDYPWAIVLLSNGQQNTAPWVEDILPGVKAAGIVVHTIGLGTGANEALLQDIATQTGGTYHFAPSSQDLASIYNAISAAVAGQQTLFSGTGTVQQGFTDEKQAIIDSSVSEATFSIAWGGSDLDLTLETPSGVTIDPAVAATDPNIDFVSGPTYEYYRIKSPDAGTWKLKIFGRTTASSSGSSGVVAAATPAEETYTARVTVRTRLTVELYFDRDDYVAYDPIKVLVTLSDYQPILGATVIATIQPPLSSSSQMTLYDDGAHGDGAADDGTYANSYTDTAADGSYSFAVDASGTSNTGEAFTRQLEESTYVAQTPSLPADIYITMTGPAEVEQGLTLSYDITYGNNGPTGGVSVTIESVFPEGASYVGDTLGGVQLIPGVGASWILGVLDPGEQGSFTLDLSISHTITPGIIIENTVSVFDEAEPDGSLDPNCTDNFAVVTTTVQAAPTPTVIYFPFILKNYPPDATPPATVTNLRTSNPSLDSITLNWTAPGDDGNTGTAWKYDIRYSTSPITDANWNTAAQCAGEPAPKPAGSSEAFTVHGLTPNTTYYFALKTADEVPNWSGLSNVASGATLRPSDQLIINCGFETDEGWLFGESPRPAAYTTEDAHWGARSVRLGIKPPTTDAYSWSSVRQRITIPANAKSATLSFWYKPFSEAPCWSNWQQFDWSDYRADQPGRIPPERNLRSWSSCDWQQAFILADDFPKATILATVMNISSNSRVWTNQTFDLMFFRGQTVWIYFNVYNNGSGYGRTWMYVDDASVMVYY